MTNDPVAVEYVGLKDSEADHLYGTGLVWHGKGDVQLVPAATWGRMRKHTDVWRAVAAQAVTSDGAIPSGKTADGNAPAAEESTKPPTGATLADLDAMTDDEVRAFAKANNVQLHPKLGSEKLRPKVREALVPA